MLDALKPRPVSSGVYSYCTQLGSFSLLSKTPNSALLDSGAVEISGLLGNTLTRHHTAEYTNILKFIKEKVSEWVSECVGFNVPLDTIGHFGDESFQAINCTGTDNQKQSNTTLHKTRNTKEKQKTTALANKTIYTLIRKEKSESVREADVPSVFNKRLANAKKPCDCSVLCLRPKRLLYRLYCRHHVIRQCWQRAPR